MADKLKVTLVKSPIGCVPKHRRTVEALGLKKVNKKVELPDNAAVRGMVNQVSYLVKVEEALGGTVMDLSNLQPAEGSRQNDNFRRGRGHGSGNGKTAGKGHKGQKARSGAPRPGFEGGQMPLYRRLPKRGFKNRNSKEIVGINVDALNRYEDGAVVTVETMIETGLVSNPRDGVKILGNGEVTKKLTVKANAFSESAKAKIEAAGVSIVQSIADSILQSAE